ncbi:MAG: heme biosynthesis HemY N-terminal domain-containing protein [Thiobacillus sp.]
MRWLISFLVLVVLAVGLALAGRYDPGYAVLVYPPWRIEISFIAFVLLMVGIMLGAYLITRLAIATLNLPRIVREQRELRETERRDADFVEGLRAWLEGRHQDAEQALGNWQGESSRRGLARVLAARAAGEMRALPQLDLHLEQAIAHGAEFAAHLAHAEIRLNAGDIAGAMGAVAAAKQIAPQHTGLLRVELSARQRAGQWHEVQKLTEQLVRANALDPAHAHQLRRAAHIELLKRSGADDHTLLEYWKNLPDKFKTDALVASASANAFVQSGGNDTALDIIEAALHHEWHEELVTLYGNIAGNSPARQIEQAEKWLHATPRDANLLLTLAKLCSAQALWGKAQNYLEASLALAPSADAHIRMAELWEKTGQAGEACLHYQKALALCRREKV